MPTFSTRSVLLTRSRTSAAFVAGSTAGEIAITSASKRRSGHASDTSSACCPTLDAAEAIRRDVGGDLDSLDVRHLDEG